jgi:hypothetical protein
MQYNKGYRCVYSLNIHLVLVTKYWRKVINQEILKRLHEILASTCEKWSSKLMEIANCASEGANYPTLLSRNQAIPPTRSKQATKTSPIDSKANSSAPESGRVCISHCRAGFPNATSSGVGWGSL